jgi:glutathione S-transferase
MLHFYGSPMSPYVAKVQYLLEEAGIPYQYRMVNLRDPADKAALAKVSPFGKVPAIEVDGFHLGESSAITRYLLARYNLTELYPANLEDRAQVDMVTEFVQAHVNRWMQSLIWNLSVAPKLGQLPDAKAISEANAQLTTTLARLESWLDTRNYLAGPNFSLADVVLLPVLAEYRAAQISLQDFPRLHAWLERVSARPAWKRFQADYQAKLAEYLATRR